MQKLLIVTACLACVGESGRVKSSGVVSASNAEGMGKQSVAESLADVSDAQTVKSVPKIAALLLAVAGQAAAFNPTQSIGGFGSRGAVSNGVSHLAQHDSGAIGSKRVAPIMMGESVRELRERVGSVRNTKKITSAMKLVAAAKVRRAQDAVLQSRPFSETLERVLGGILKKVKSQGLDIPLLEPRTAKKVGLIVVTGDRGLCGSYNTAAIRKAEARIEELKTQGVEAELILVGNKGDTYFKRRIPNQIRKAIPIGQSPTSAQAIELGEELLSSFYSGGIDRVELVYTKFTSLIASNPEIRTLVPLLPDGMEMEGDEVFKLTTKDSEISVERESRPAAEAKEFLSDTIFEQEPSQILNTLLPLYLNGQLLRSLQESVASELASRMQAMQSATDNAKELESSLEQKMNRARQAQITQELSELIAGADAIA